MNIEEKENLDALKNFLLDIECLDPLSKWTSKFNMFDILKISKTEIRHSNMLAWLLDPRENHGLGDEVIRRFVQYAVTSFSNSDDIFEVLLKDCDDFYIQREYYHIDIFAVSDEEKLVLCIENKVDSKEHDNQLLRYRTTIEEQYPKYKKLYIYLSPYGDEPSDSEYWCSMSYQDVLNILDVAKRRTKLIPESEMMINNYIEAIKRIIMEDEELAQICEKIYKKHQKAIDLIIENKPDKASELTKLFRKWCQKKMDEKEIIFSPEKSGKILTRFTTKEMSDFLPDADEPLSGWNTKNNYFYEIVNNNGNEFYIQFALSSKNLSNDLKVKCEKINEFYPSKLQKTNWQWRTCKKTNKSKVEDEYTEEKIYEQLDEKLKEIKKFEKELFSKML